MGPLYVACVALGCVPWGIAWLLVLYIEHREAARDADGPEEKARKQLWLEADLP